jgi:PST family polysaccharide transporter
VTAAEDLVDQESLDRRVGRGLGWSAVGNIVVRLVNVASSILMARLIAPDEFGVFAVAFTIWIIVGTLAEFGLGADLVRAHDPERRAPTIATLSLGLGAGFAVTMALTADALARAFGSPESAGVIRLLALGAVVMGLGVVPAAAMQREYRQAGLFALNGLGALTSTTVMVVLAASGAGAISLAWGQLVGQTTLVVGLYVVTRIVPRFGFDPDVARDSAGFCLPLALANVLSWLVLTADNLVVARVLDPERLGLYVIAFNVSSWPMSAVGQAVRSVALPAFAQLDGPRRGEVLVRVVGPLVAVAGLLAVALSGLAQPLVVFLYGSSWGAASAALAGLAVFGGVRVVIDVVATFLIALGATTEVLVVQVLWLLVMVPVMIVAVGWFGLVGAGWAHVVVALFVVLPAYLVCLRRAGVDTSRLLAACVRPVVCLIPAAAACWWIGGQDATPFALLAAGGLAVTLLYALPMAPWWIRCIRLLRATTQLPAPTSSMGPDA